LPRVNRSRDTQADAPLADAADRFLAEPGAPFTTPGHKRAAWLEDSLLARDLPLPTGADDSRLSNDVLGRAEALAAELWGAGLCRFAVNGSTHGNQALCLAIGPPGARVGVTRGLHKSMFAGLVLAGLEPVWMRPDTDPASGLAAGLPLDEVRRALAAGVSALLLVEPSYVGVLSDLPAIAELAHGAGVPVIADQAWGSHLGFHPRLPANALRMGADAMVVSAHKTLTAFTQGAMVFARGDLLDRDRLVAGFEALNTTSPSAAIYASLDRARRLMALRGRELLERTLALADGFRRDVADVAGVGVLDRADADPIRLVVSLAGTGADGFDVEADLLDDGVRLEMTDRETLVPLLTIGDDERSVGRLSAALRHSIAKRRGPPRPVASSAVWRLRPEPAMAPREAFFAPRERVTAARAVGRISAETAAPYPPGIPALAPGELITAELLDSLRAEAIAGTRVAYASDPSLATLLVVAQR
jgi:arginine decarboxylase